MSRHLTQGHRIVTYGDNGSATVERFGDFFLDGFALPELHQ